MTESEHLDTGYFRHIKEADKNSNFYFKPDIPAKKINNALKKYAVDLKEEDVLVLYDKTIFKNGRKGLLVTDTTLYIRDFNSVKQISIQDIDEVSIRSTDFGPALFINNDNVLSYVKEDEHAMQWFKGMLISTHQNFEREKLEEQTQRKKDKVLEEARNWWLDKPDPKDGDYICDVCNGEILEKDGTSLLSSYMRCKDCTKKLFHEWDNPESVEKKTKGGFGSTTKYICPHCGSELHGTTLLLVEMELRPGLDWLDTPIGLCDACGNWLKRTDFK